LHADPCRPGSVLVLRADDRAAVRHHALPGRHGQHQTVRRGGAAGGPRDGRAAAPRGASGERPGMTTPECPPTETQDDIDLDALREKYRREREKRLRPEGSKQYIELVEDFA